MYINIFIDGENLTVKNIYVFGFSVSLFTISYYFFDFLNKNILNLIKLFVLLFLLSSLTINFYDFKYDAPYFCGGIPDIFKLLDHETYAWGDKTLKVQNTFRENSEIYSQVRFSLKNIYLKRILIRNDTTWNISLYIKSFFN